MGFEDYKGNLELHAGLTPLGDYPLMQTCDIMADNEGTRLDVYLANMKAGVIANLDEELSKQEKLIREIKSALQDKADDGLYIKDGYWYIDGTNTGIKAAGEDGKTAYEYALSVGYTGTEAEFAEKLLGYDSTMVGTWVLKDDPDLTTMPEYMEVEFTSNGMNYTSMTLSTAGSSSWGIYTIVYGSTGAVYVNNPGGSQGIEHGWTDNAYKTLNITKEPDENTATWIRENAEKAEQQSESDVRLKTKNKRIVDAINELADQIANGGSTENVMSKFNVSYEHFSVMSEIITAIENAGGNRSQYNYVQLSGYESLLLLIKFINYGGNTNKVQCVDVINDRKIYNADNDNVIDVSTKYIRDFLEEGVPSITEGATGGAVDTSTLATVDKISGISVEGEFSNINTSNGLYWTDSSTITVGDDNDYDHIQFTNRVPITAGENVTFTVDAEKNLVKINATGSSSSSGGSLEMPQIRFTSANGNDANGMTTTFYVDQENPLKLTVEIVGGGDLKVGDALQVCVRKRFNGSFANGNRRKYKLQRFAEYVVTEDDLNKRYLTVYVACGDGYNPAAYRGLFRDGNVGDLSPLYLRIRRPKGGMQANDSGQTVNAEFSNIVTIWKASHRGNQLIRIY